MIREFRLPDVGEGVAEGELVEWLVDPGDPVTEDQPVAEVETDKALVELPSPYDGTVHELHAVPGEVVPVGEVIISFDVPEEGEGGEEVGESGGEAVSAEGSGAAGGGPAEEEPDALDGESAAEDTSATGEPPSTATADTAPARPGGPVAPPSVRRLARELGVDLAAVDGSGPGGRVTEADVRAATGGEPTGDEAAATGAPEESAAGPPDETGPETADERPEPRAVERNLQPAVTERAAESGPSDGAGAEPAGRDRTLAAPATRRLAAEMGVDVDDVPTDRTREGEAFVTPEQVRAYAAAGADAGDETAAGPTAGGPGEATREPAGAEAAGEPAGAEGRPSGERVPYRGVRRTIGRQMERAKFTAPHVTHHDTADATDLVALREELNEAADVRITYLPLVMRAVVAGLREFPSVNAQLDEERGEIVLRDEYNIGVATATDAGLMVPVVEGVDAKGLETLAREVAERTERARDRTIDREELQGGTFTITNVGTIGGEYATPIINHPEVAVLALGAISDRPRVVDGEVVARKTLPLSLSVDHRVVDGAVAARFTNHVIDLLEHPWRLLLELA